MAVRDTDYALRLASIEDRQTLFDLLAGMHREIGLASLDEDKVWREIEEHVDSDGAYLIEHGGEVVGSIALCVIEPWYSTDRMLQDTWLYVVPEHRNLTVFRMILDAAVECSARARLPLTLGLQSVQDGERKEILFRRYLAQVMRAYRFVPVGGVFMPREK